MRTLTVLIAILTLAGTPATAAESDPIKPLDGGETGEVSPGAAVWSDREYTFTEWPEDFANHRVFHRSPIGKTKLEVLRPGYVVVLTPENQKFDQEHKLTFFHGFERVDLPSFHPYRINAEREGNLCHILQKKVFAGDVVDFGYYGIALWSDTTLPIVKEDPDNPFLPIPTIDISGETERHSIVARGTKDIYQGHVDTVLMPDGKTIWATWVINHAGHLGPLAKSEDGGKTWSGLLPSHPSWEEQTQTTPTIHHLVDPNGVARLFVFAGRDFPGRLRQSYSEDGGKTWTPMAETGLKAECAPKTIMSFDEGKRLVMWCDRRGPDSKANESKGACVWESESLDGGLTWGPERVVVKTLSHWAQPAVIASDKDDTLIMLLRVNQNDYGQFAVSPDRGKTWSEAKQLPAALTGHRPAVKRAPDGRIVVVMRDTATDFENGKIRNPTAGHFVAWVGTFDDILNGRDGQYRIKLLHSYAGRDTGYSGFELLPDGTFVATTYIKYRGGPEKHSVVSTRFKLDELDARLP
ncbi:sialidase family protein [Verrucomicrobiales bacterium BCK34]|nr:sialidase family protein [Verrucomicrobiales bacterium BCK34]